MPKDSIIVRSLYGKKIQKIQIESLNVNGTGPVVIFIRLEGGDSINIEHEAVHFCNPEQQDTYFT